MRWRFGCLDGVEKTKTLTTVENQLKEIAGHKARRNRSRFKAYRHFR